MTEHTMDDRVQALREARITLRGIDFDREDVLVVADWLLTGKATLALEISAQNAENYRVTPEFLFEAWRDGTG